MNLKTTKSARLNKILGIGTRVVGKSLTGVLSARSELQTRIEQAQLIADGLSELKGAAMKLGQMLSIQGENFFPKEVTDILAKLQNAAPAITGAEVKTIVIKELGENFKSITSFSEKAIAAASIGQVHRGVLESGDVVAMKVQYPGVAEAIDSEIDLLKRVVGPLAKFYLDGANLDSVFVELKNVLKQEVDYKKEAGFLEQFAGHLRNEPQFVVPKVYPSLSTSKVLTMSFEHGTSVREFVKTNPTQEEVNNLGRSIFELLMKEIFVWRTIQTDPNFGNYLIRPSPTGTKIVLLDFGACKTYTENFINSYREFGKLVRLEKRQEALECGYRLKFIYPEESEEAQNLFFDMCRLTLEPFIQDSPYDFGNSDLPKKVTETIFKCVRRLKFTPPPADVIFLNRKLGGVYNLFRALGVKENFRELNDRYMGL